MYSTDISENSSWSIAQKAIQLLNNSSENSPISITDAVLLVVEHSKTKDDIPHMVINRAIEILPRVHRTELKDIEK